MMRMKLMTLAAAAILALPLTASAWGRKSGCDSCSGGGQSHFAGLFGNLHNEPPAPSNKLGHGFFQPPFQAAPWYLYWPYDAHFQLPAPIGAAYQPPQGLNTPWNPYFAHPALGMGGPPAGPAPGGFAPAPFGN
jgi:hypothetical protein